MQHVDLRNIKINQIQIFLEAVNCGSFSGAAESLHVTQPMVSKTIQALEKERGIILFIRSKGKLNLTPAGKDCYNQWSNMLKYLESSVESAHAIQEGAASRLHIGTGSMGIERGKFFDLLQRFKEEKAISLYVECHAMTQLIEELQNDKYDAIFISKHLLGDIESRGLKWKKIQETQLAIFVPWENPLSDRDELSFADLKKESFIAFSVETDPHYLELLNHLAGEAGFIPKIACYIPNEESFEVNLMLNNGIALIDSMVKVDEDVAKMFPLKDLPNDHIMVWKESNASPALKQFLAYLDQHIRPDSKS